MTNPFDQFDAQTGVSNPFDQFDAVPATAKRPQDSALTRGTTQAINAGKTAKALTIGDYDEVARLTAERDAYRKANPGTKEGNELSAAWEAGDGVMGGVKNVAGELVKDWQEAPSTVDAIRATGKNLSAMGGGIVEQVPNMVMPMAGLLAGGAAGSTAGPVGAVVGGWAGATAGNAAAESPEQVDRSLQDAGIDPQDSAAVKAHLEANGGKIAGQALTKGAVIGAVDTATMGASNQLLKGAAKATRTAALARNVAAAALEPAGEFAGEYLGQGLATGDYDAKGATLEALSSLGQSGITFAGQKAYQYATNPFTRTNEPGSASLSSSGTTAEENQPGPVLALPSPTYTGAPSDQLLQAEVARQREVDAAQANADAIYAARDQFEEENRQKPLRFTLTTDPEPIQQHLDAMLGIDQSRISEKERAAYEQAWNSALNEPVGITHDENGHERPLSMYDYLQAQQQAADKGRQLAAAETVSPAGQTALDRLAQVADEETAPAVDIPEIPVIGPLSAAANHAVRSGVSAQLQQASAPVIAPMGDTSRQQAIEANRARLEQTRAKRQSQTLAGEAELSAAVPQGNVSAVAPVGDSLVGNPVTAPAQSTAAMTPQQPVMRQASPIMRRDDLVGAIMRVTGGNGIASSMADTLIGEKANRPGKLRGVFTNAGQQDLDDLAMLLREQEGYDVRDGGHLAELVRQAASGDVAKSMARLEADAEAAKEKAHRDEVRAQAKKLGIKTVAVPFTEIEQNVFRLMEQRHARAVERLDARAKARYDAMLKHALNVADYDEIDAIIADGHARLSGREFFLETTRQLRSYIDDVTREHYRQELANETEDGEAIGRESAEPEWISDGVGTEGSGSGRTAVAAPEGSRSATGQQEEGLTRQTNEQAAAQYAQQEAAEPSGISKAQADAEREAVPFSLSVQSQPKPQGVQTGLFTPDGRISAEAAPEGKPEQFSNNKLFTADKVAAARARLKSKLNTLNSGIDPELLVDGMTIAGAYIESGVRNFTQYAKLMIEDLGDGVKPYLLSFWEGARNFPGLDTKDMTDAAESARQHQALISTADVESAKEAVGEVAKKPAKRTKKTGAKGDMVLTQDWGTEHIDGYGDAERENGNDTKDAFLKETRNYLNAVADALRAFGFEPHADRKGAAEKPVSVNESGVAGSGDVTLTMRHAENENNVYIHIGDTALRGIVPVTPSGIAIMYRVGQGSDRYASKAGNTWAPVDLSANDLAALVGDRVPTARTEGNGNARTLPTEQLPGTVESGVATDAATGNGDRQPLDAGVAQARESADRSGAVSSGTEVAGRSGEGSVQPAGEQTPGTARDSGIVRAEQRASDPVADPATAEVSPKPELDAPADHQLDAADIGKGGLTKKYRDNISAIRILKAMAAEGRKATPDERRQIARYVGWGALKGVFDKDNKQWGKEFAELRELLTDAEYKAARASTLNAHYTSPTVIGGVYQALERLGFTRGRINEPAVGTGNFFGLMPAKMRKASQLHGTELDPLTSRIAAALYPSAKIAQATAFQDVQIPAEYFDLAIGNPPFGSEPIVDDDRSPYSGFSIHNYFFAKSIDKLRPGGLLAMVVSHNFLDAKTDSARKWIAERANLVSAVRLPRTAFKENAGTDVVTDIVIFQKKSESERANALGDSSWVNAGEQILSDAKTGEDTKHSVSQYFLSNPDSVLGTPVAAGSMYRSGEYTVEPSGDLGKQLKAWADGLPQGVYQAIERTHEKEAADVAIPDGVKVGSYFIDAKGEVQMRGPDAMGNRTATAWVAPNGKAAERMRGMIGLREGLRTQMRLERSPEAPEAAIESGRAALNKLYDNFQSKHGYLNDPTNRRIFLDDTESALLLALEFDYDKGVSRAVAEREDIEERPAKAIKADIFSRRVMFPPSDNIKVSNAKDALLASLNYKGRLDVDYMAGLYDKPAAEIVKELGDVVFTDPVNGVVMADEYLSGDVKTKLAEAESAALDNAEYRRNVEVLKKVIPADKRPSEIHAVLGATFVPVDLFQEFAREITGDTPRVTYVRATGQWLVEFNGTPNPALDSAKWGIAKMPARSIFIRTMAGQGVVVTQTVRNGDGSTTTVVLEQETEAAREKQSAMKTEWQRWLWSNPDRANRVAGIYNEKMNRIVVRKYDGSHMTFPGMSPAMTLLGHQKNAVWRALQSRQILLDHVVGAGKTFEVVATIMEMRRLGIARKPIIAVPNHLTLQWRSEFSRLYPAANVLAATPEDFSKGNREKFFSKIITGDWDAVIVGHSSLKKIPLPAETEKAVLQEQIDEIAGAIEDMKRARGDRNIVRDMEGIKARLEARMKLRLQALGERDKVVSFDELGADAFAIDEIHEFKNVFYNSTMERVPGMGNPSGSDKAFDLFVKIQHLFNTFGDKAPIIGATGTPVSNSLVEMFNMQRLLQYPTLKAEGLHVFDAWAKQFGSVESLYEVSPSGTGYRQSSRFAKFKNLPALMSHYQTFADTVTLGDLKAQEEARGNRFPVPRVASGRPVNVVAKRSPLVADFMGVPQLDIQNNKVVFGFNPDSGETVSIKETQEGAWKVTRSVPVEGGKELNYSLGTAKTEEDARLLVVEAGLSPQITVDPKSILGQFQNLKQLTRQTKGKVNALSLTGKANKAGLDYRLIDPGAPDFEGSKINLSIDRMMALYQKWADDKGAQLVFCDLSVPLSSRSGFNTKERRIYVRENGELTHKRGTMHTVSGHEDLPFFVVKDGGKEAKSFAIYDAATGLKVHSGLPTKGIATDWAAQSMSEPARLQHWIEARDALGDIDQEAIDEYNNEHEIDTEETESISLADVAGMSGSAKFSVYDDIKAKLIARGVPEREIAFIHDYSTPAAKDKLFKAVNSGSVRFLLGSTPKMGAGTNVQKLLVGLHHIDAPWRPSDLEQREGRIIRRGNTLYERDPNGFEVEVYRYATEQTYDTRRWQILEHKARGIEQLRNYDGTLNEIDDIEGEAANSADMKAAASGDPLILEETQLRNEVRRLESLQASHADETSAMGRRASENDRYANEVGPLELAAMERIEKAAAAFPVKKDEFAGLNVGGKKYTEREDAVKAIKGAMDKVFTEGGSETMLYRGVEFTIEGSSSYAELNSPTGNLDRFRPMSEITPSAAGFLTRFANYINRAPAHIADIKAKIENAKKTSADLREQSGKQFAQADELTAAREEHKRVQRRLIAKGPDIPARQKQILESATKSQREALRKAGYGEALDEFMGNNSGEVLGSQSQHARISTADKAIYSMAVEGQGAQDVLGFIAQGSRSLFNRQLAKALIKTEIATSLAVGDGKGWKFNAGEGNKYAAAYNPKTDTAALFRPAEAERHVLHELVHAATLKALQKRGLAATQMRRLYEFVKKSGKLHGQYGMSNVDEFVAEAFTNPKFQQALMRINAPDLTGLEKKNAWHWFIRLVRNILGLRSGSHDALSQALMLGTRVMQENMHLTENAGGPAKHSQSAMKNTEANIRRGKQALAEAITGKTTVHRAMFRNGLGWIDFVWGNEGKVKPSGKTKGAMGLSHIFESRIRKDGMTEKGVITLLGRMVETIAEGAEIRRNEFENSTTVVFEKNGIEALLTKRKGSNAWVVSGWVVPPGASSVGSVTTGATSNSPTTAQREGGAGETGLRDGTEPPQNIDENKIRYNIVGDSGRSYDAKQREFFKNVGRDVEKVSRVQSAVDYLKTDFFKKMAVGMVDQFRGLRDLNDSGHAYLLARLSKGTAGAFEALLHHGKLMIKEGVYDADTSGGFVERLGVPLHGELDDFLWWVAANRAEGLKTESEAIRAEGARLLSQAYAFDKLAREKTLQAEQILQQAGDFPKSMLGNQRAQKANAAHAHALIAEAKALRAAAVEARNEGNAKKNVERERLFSGDDIASGKSLASGLTTFDYTLQTGAAKGKTTRSRAIIYQDALRVFNEFQKNTLDMAEQSGLIDGSTRKYWESDFYVPFYRVSEEDGEFVGAKMGNALVRQQAFKKLKGGTDKLNSDLLSNTLLNWAHLIEASAKNRAAKATLEAAEECGAAHKATAGEKKTVWHLENGKKVEYGVDDPFVMTAITSLEYAGMRNGIMDVMSKFKHWLTIGVTASPAFKVRNLIRDSLQAIGTSDLSYNPVKNITEGWKLTNKESQSYVSALASGGLVRFGTMLEGSESSRVRQLIRSGVKDSSILNNEGKWQAFYDKYLEPGISAYNELGNRSEEINRAALYSQLIKQGKSHAEAALLARDLMDFSMQGSFNTIRFLTQVTPFLNARMQGMYKLGRTAKDNPRKLAIVTGAVAVASIGLMLAYGDDDDWKRREDWDRDNYFWFKFAGQEFRIPKPFEVGAVATLAERSFEYVLSDEMTGERFRRVVGDLLWNNLSMNPTPQVFKPIIDLYANEDSFTNRPIETQGMQRLDKEMRYDSGTSMVARGLSATTLGALSPVQYDFLVRSYFSWLGATVVGGADMAARALSDEPTQPALDYFKFATLGIVRQQSTGSSRYVSMLYRQAEELEKAYATYRQLLKDGKREEAADYASDNADKLTRYKQVERVKKMETLLNSRIRFIERSDIDPGEKREQIKVLQQRKEQAARMIAPGI